MPQTKPMFKIKHLYWFYLLASILLVAGVMSLHLLTVKQSQAALSWTKVTVHSTGNVGLYPSIALNTSDNPRISYSGLKYAYCDSGCETAGNWILVNVDSVGDYTSLALTASGNPRVSYYDGSGNENLKYAYCDSGCGTSGNWIKVTVDATGNVGRYTSLALDTSGNPHISYRDVTNQDLKYAYYTGTGTETSCGGGSANWKCVAADSTGDNWDPSIALTTSNNPRISYMNYANLKYTYCNSDCGSAGNWTKVTVDTSGDVGNYITSLAINTSDNPRISYYYTINQDLKYAYCDSSCGTSGNWTKVTVDATGSVGKYVSLALDTSGNPRISYYDETNKDLKYAYYVGGGGGSGCASSDWTCAAIDSTGDVGWYSSIALDSSNYPRIAYFDYSNYDLKYAYAEWLEQATPTATVSNESPAASGVTINSSSNVNLTENTTASVTCEGAVTDNNGCGDVQDTKAYLYRSSVTSSGCDDPGEADNDQCYYADNTACSPVGGTCTGGSDLTVNYTCSVSFQYYADATDVGSYYAADNWLCTLVPQDEGAGAGDESDAGVEVNTLTALNIDASISYGTLALGANTGATNQQTVVTATGNVGIDTNLQGTTMACATGSITVGYQEYSNGTFTYGAETDLTGGDVELDLDVLKRDSTGGNDYTKEVYWGLGAPSQGPEGACSGTNTATAVTDANCGYTSCD